MGVQSVAPPAVAEELKADDRDVADLWKQALKSYKGIVGFDLERKFDNVQSMVDFGTVEMNAFHSFRHNKKKVDKLRSLFAANLGYLEQGAQQLIGAAVPAFPPAAAIGTAVTYLLTACKQVSADYDVVVVFFDDMNSFLERVVILETRLPQQGAYQNCLMDVFSSFLSLCGYAHKYIELGRFKKWISNLVDGEDSELGGARKKMDKTLTRLQNATEFAILGNSEELKKMSSELQINQESHTRMLEEQREVLVNVRQDTESIRSDMSKLLKAFNDQAAKHEHKGKPPTQDAGKPASATRVRNAMPTVEGDGHEYRILKETLIPDTCTWIFSEPEWDEWMKQDGTVSRPLLTITGQPGIGKSHLAAVVHDKLSEFAKQDTSLRTCVAHFYFREQHRDLRIFLAGVITVINQVVEQSAPLCERINAEMVRDDVTYNIWLWKDLLSKILGPAFQEKGPNRLFIVFDGLDELLDSPSILEFIKLVAESKYRISIVITSRTELLPSLREQCETTSIEVTKEKQLPDFKALAWHRINDLGHLRKFSRYVQQRIAEKVEEVSPNLLYLEHMLAKLNALGREGAALQALSRPMPPNMHDFYESMLAECQRRMPAARRQIASKLLHWIAFSYRVLTLDEITSLLVYLSDDDSFTLEEIPEVASKFLQIGDPGFDAEARENSKTDVVGTKASIQDLDKAGQNSTHSDEIYKDGSLPVKFKERSMRQFFRDPPKDTESEWRWRESEAHRQIFLISVGLVKPEPLGPDRKMDEGLQKYAAFYLLGHFVPVKPDETSISGQAELMEALAIALSNKTQFAEMLSKTAMTYDGKAKSTVNDQVVKWAEVFNTTDAKTKLSEFAIEWWSDVAVDPRRCRLGMLKGYMRRVYDANDLEEALKMYKLFIGVLGLAELQSLVASRAKINFPDEFSEDDDDGEDDGEDDAKPEPANESKDNTEKKEENEDDLGEVGFTLGLSGLFDDITMDEKAYRAVAELLFNYKLSKPALETCHKALELCHSSNCIETYKILTLQAKILLKLGKKDEALQTITDCTKNLKDDDVPTSLKRLALMTKARIQTRRKEWDMAAESYAAAKHIDPEGQTPGDALVRELAIFEKRSDDAGYIRTLKSWSPLDMLTWMAWNYPDDGEDRHWKFRCIGIKTGEGDFVIDAYSSAIKFLDKLNAGAPLKVELAMSYLHVVGDAQMSRKTMDEVFDSGSNGWPYGITNETPQDMIQRAVDIMSDALYEIFRASRDPKVKMEALDALRGLMKRQLSTDVPIYSNLVLVHRRIIIAAMCLKMGQATEFQERLQSILDDCFAGLKDTVSWNDAINIEKLGHALALFSKAVPNGEDIHRYARIVGSAMFSKLDLHHDEDEDEDEGGEEGGDDDDDSDSEDDEDDEDSNGDSKDNSKDSKAVNKEPPADEGDLTNSDFASFTCDGGVCNPRADFRWWGNLTAHYCTECSNTIICDICYEARHNPDVTASTRIMRYCDKGHSSIKLPVEGWRGVKDGKLRIEGEEDVDVEEFMRKLQDEVCKDAWDRFWGGV